MLKNFRCLNCERLEGRLLMAIDWVNVGSDNFDQVYGGNASLARNIVNEAISAWESVITDFNYDSGSPNFGQAYQLNLSAGYLQPAVAGVTSGISQDAQSRPYAANVVMDNDGGNSGWYFDSDVASNLEFHELGSAFEASATSGTAGNNLDFYTVALHEIGHAIGILGHASDPLDLMATSAPVGSRRLISDAAVDYLDSAYGYTTVSPSDTMYVESVGATVHLRGLDYATDSILVTPLPGHQSTTVINGRDVSLEASGLNASSGRFVVDSGDGSDLVNIDDRGGHLQSEFEVYAASSASTLWYQLPENQGNTVNAYLNPFMYNVISVNGAENYLFNIGRFQVNGGNLNDTITVDALNAAIFVAVAGSGNDTVDTQNLLSTVAYVYGGNGDDTIRFGVHGGYAFGEVGNDSIYANGGSNYLSGGLGNDWISGGSGSDTIYGNEGIDYIFGNDGNDALFGGSGSDYISGGSGDDFLYDGVNTVDKDVASYDRLYGGLGNDFLSGSSQDTLVS